jgi:hypothetical protein
LQYLQNRPVGEEKREEVMLEKKSEEKELE